MAKLLFISGHLPSSFGTQAGEKTSYRVLELLARKHRVWVVGMTNQSLNNSNCYVKSLCVTCEEVTVFFVSNLTRIVGILSSLGDPICVGARRSNSMWRHLERLQYRIHFDAVFFDHTQMLQYAPIFRSDQRLFVLVHDILHQAAERRADGETNIFLRQLMNSESRRLKQWEFQALMSCCGVIVQSENDRELLLKHNPAIPVSVIPPYVDASWTHRCAWVAEKKTRSIVFWGAMHRRENIDAVLRFSKTILPLIKSRIPDVVFYVVGARPSKSLLDLGNRENNVKITGFVESPIEYFERSMVAVAPLSLGAGIKVKVLECMMCGLPVVASPIAAAGLSALEEHGLFVENTTSSFAERVVQLLLCPDKARQLGEKARRFVSRHYGWWKSMQVMEAAFSI